MSIPSFQMFLARLGRQRVAALSAAVLFVLVGGAACGGSSGAPGDGGGGGRGGPGGGPARATPVEILTLAEKPVEISSEFVGTVRSRRSMTVQSQVEGFIKRIHVKSGDRVKPGTVLVEIDDTSQLAVVAGLESVRAARDADATFARQQAERARRLLASGAISQMEHDQAQSTQKAAEAQLKAVEEQIRQQKNEWGYTRVTASTAGVIGDVPVRVGDRVTRQTLLTTVEDNTNLELYLNIPVQDAPRLKLGLPVRVLDESGAERATERINFISPSADDATQTVLLKTPISARGGALRADQFVRARVVWSTAPALTVPLVAVLRISGQYFVYVAEPGDGGALVARQRPVALGSMVGNDYLIISGLKAGDRVIVAGTQKIGDGAPVAPAAPGPPAPADPAKGGGPASPKPAEPAKAGGS